MKAQLDRRSSAPTVQLLAAKGWEMIDATDHIIWVVVPIEDVEAVSQKAGRDIWVALQQRIKETLKHDVQSSFLDVDRQSNMTAGDVRVRVIRSDGPEGPVEAALERDILRFAEVAVINALNALATSRP